MRAILTCLSPLWYCGPHYGAGDIIALSSRGGGDGIRKLGLEPPFPSLVCLFYSSPSLWKVDIWKLLLQERSWSTEPGGNRGNIWSQSGLVPSATPWWDLWFCSKTLGHVPWAMSGKEKREKCSLCVSPSFCKMSRSEISRNHSQVSENKMVKKKSKRAIKSSCTCFRWPGYDSPATASKIKSNWNTQCATFQGRLAQLNFLNNSAGFSQYLL